jgi:hypothetical protein
LNTSLCEDEVSTEAGQAQRAICHLASSAIPIPPFADYPATIRRGDYLLSASGRLRKSSLRPPGDDYMDVVGWPRREYAAQGLGMGKCDDLQNPFPTFSVLVFEQNSHPIGVYPVQ